MKSIFNIILTVMATAALVTIPARAAIMDFSANGQTADDHTAREEAEGKAVWEKLSAKGGSASGGQTKELTCKDLSDDNFGTLGEYFMGLMMGEQHEAMDAMMVRTMGETGEEQMHVATGKRMGGCDPNASVPQNMMSGMAGGMTGWQTLGKGGDSKMMGNFGAYGYGSSFFGFFGMLIMIIFWVLVIVAIVALIRWLMIQGQNNGPSHSAIDILKERYAKGEINKEEFESKKRDLV